MNTVTTSAYRFAFSAIIVLIVSGIVAASGDVPVGGEAAVKPPLPIHPSDYETITSRHPAFRFNGRWHADKYVVQLADNAAFDQAKSVGSIESIVCTMPRLDRNDRQARTGGRSANRRRIGL